MTVKHLATDREPTFLTPKEVTEKYRISEPKLQEMRRKGTGPEFIYLGRRSVVYKPEKIEEWLDSNSRMTTRDNNINKNILFNRLTSIAKEYCQSGEAEDFANHTQKIINTLT